MGRTDSWKDAREERQTANTCSKRHECGDSLANLLLVELWQGRNLESRNLLSLCGCRRGNLRCGKRSSEGKGHEGFAGAGWSAHERSLVHTDETTMKSSA